MFRYTFLLLTTTLVWPTNSYPATPAGCDLANNLVLIENLGGTYKVAKDRPGKPVVKIDLSGEKVTDQSLKLLRAFKTVEELIIQVPELTGPGLKHLARLNQLRELRLYGAHVNDRALSHLKGLSRLRHLGVRIRNAHSGMK